MTSIGENEIIKRSRIYEALRGGTSKNKSRNAKLPDVANHFGVKCENLFYFMRQMKFKL